MGAPWHTDTARHTRGDSTHTTKSAGRNVESTRIESENSSHTKPVSHTDSETREPTVQFSDRRPYSLLQFTDSLDRTDSRRARTYTRDSPPPPSSSSPTAGQITHCQRTPRIRRSAGRNCHPPPLVKLDILIQFEYINSILGVQWYTILPVKTNLFTFNVLFCVLLFRVNQGDRFKKVII